MVVIPASRLSALHETEKTNLNEKPIHVPKKNYIKQRASERLNRILKIVLSLAKIQGYDASGRIRSGQIFLEHTDIIPLINHALSSQKFLYGEQESINLLIEAKIDPDLILNENIRSKILSFAPKQDTKLEEPHVYSEIKETSTQPKPQKRSAEESEDEPLRKKKLLNWTIPESDDE